MLANLMQCHRIWRMLVADFQSNLHIFSDFDDRCNRRRRKKRVKGGDRVVEMDCPRASYIYIDGAASRTGEKGERRGPSGKERLSPTMPCVYK